MNSTYKKNKHVAYWIEDGILMAEIFEKEFTLAIAKKVVEFRSTNFPGQHLHLTKMNDSSLSITREARNYFGTPEGCVGLKKLAIMSTTPIMKMLGNFFIYMAKPVIPTKLFTDEEKAKEWLKEN